MSEEDTPGRRMITPHHWYDPIIHTAVNIIAVIGVIVGLAIFFRMVINVRKQWNAYRQENDRHQQGTPDELKAAGLHSASNRFSITPDGYTVVPLQHRYHP